ncbi:MAG TPA: rhomboid family intramembrane serine protease [Deltaproteobacteria bacterium]|nr:rhomboid family intramembrane serine protease [Deltaproteobacteria bacterium]
MIPIRDTIPSRTYPVVNNAIIAVNIIVFLIEMMFVSGIDRFIYTYGLVPARYTVPSIAVHFTLFDQLVSFVSFMFLHGGFWHLLGNMWFLYIFGDNVEDHFGHVKYLIFYLLCGWLSGMTHLVVNWTSHIPTIGASGAVAGVMGAYFILYPRARVLTVIPIIIIPYFIEIPAAFFLAVWFLFQFLNAALSDAHAAGIAWWAHIGGFIFGIILLKLMKVLPSFTMPGAMRDVTRRTRTPRLHVVKPTDETDAYDIYGSITITSKEAISGTRKIVDIRRGLQEKFFVVTIPPGVKEGSVLRLKGIGQKRDNDQRGDVYLKIIVQPERYA